MKADRPIAPRRSDLLDRKRFLTLLGGAGAGFFLTSCGRGRQQPQRVSLGEEVEARVARVIEAYDGQGIHRTGTEGDLRCAEWLLEEARAAGAEADLETMAFPRLDVVDCHLEVGAERFDGVPVFNAPATGPEGTSGRLGRLQDGRTEISFTASMPQGRGGTLIEEYRLSTGQKAMVLVTGGPRFGLPPGLALINAEGYPEVYGPPAIHVGSEAWEPLEALEGASEARVVNHWQHTEVEVSNTVATVPGRDRTLAPIVVMTPRSGWWSCASERGGGIAVWLEMIRALATVQPARDVHFVASTGHELGHFGLERYLDQRHQWIAGARAWVHLGANFGAAIGGGSLLQASSREMRQMMLDAWARHGRSPATETPVGEPALGEAGNIFEGGGEFVSIIGSNGLFHHPDDRWPQAVDLDAVVDYAHAFAELGVELAAT